MAQNWEPASNLTEPDLQDMITNWNKAHANCIPTCKDTALDSHLPNIKGKDMALTSKNHGSATEITPYKTG